MVIEGVFMLTGNLKPEDFSEQKAGNPLTDV